jgi:hypothetical protein
LTHPTRPAVSVKEMRNLPNRILRDGILTSERVNALTPGAEILYRRLMSVVDDYGRYHGNPSLVLSACFPLTFDRVSLTDVREWLTEVGQSPALVDLYEVNGKKYLQINNFGQRTRSEPKFPPPSADNCQQSADICAQLSASRARTSASTTPTTTPPAAAEKSLPDSPGYSTEWPLTTAAIRKRDPAVDDFFVRRLADTTAQRLISVGDMGTFDDEDLANAIDESYAKFQGGKHGKHGTGLLLQRVPQIILGWEATNGGTKET